MSSRIAPASTDVILLDTSVAVELRDRGLAEARTRGLTTAPLLSIFTLIELEGGVYAHPEFVEERRRRLDVMLRGMATLPFDEGVIAAYGRIVAAIGFSRRKIIDRLIAATAIVHDLTLIATNDDDFADVPGLKLEVWPVQ